MSSNTLRTSCVRVLQRAAIFSVILAGLAGCPGEGTGTAQYDAGFDAGFAQDQWYYNGYQDSWLTEDVLPILYSGDTIPFIDDLSYNAGLYDGWFYAYNDGYFVAYRYAFIIGFSEGYDVAFRPEYLDILAEDNHIEQFNGGFTDGYNDGFSEGAVFGAFDFEQGLVSDWLDAFLDWQDGTDLYFEEIDEGTGELGPVTLYEWGINPHALIGVKAPRIAKTAADRTGAQLRGRTKAALEFERPLTTTLENDLDVKPSASPRSDIPLELDTTWLERIDAYQAAKSLGANTKRNR